MLQPVRVRGDPARPAVLVDDQGLVQARARDDRGRPPPLRADHLLGAPGAAAAPPRRRLPGARAVRRPADHPRRRAAQLLQGHAPRAVLVPRQARPVPRRRLRDPRVPVHLLLARRRLPLDRRAHADRGVAEPRSVLANDPDAGHPSEHQDRGAQRRLPHPCDRDGRVHDREPLRLPHLPDVSPVHQRDQAYPLPPRR